MGLNFAYGQVTGVFKTVKTDTLKSKTDSSMIYYRRADYSIIPLDSLATIGGSTDSSRAAWISDSTKKVPADLLTLDSVKANAIQSTYLDDGGSGFYVATHLFADADNTYDIGQYTSELSNRFRKGFFSDSVIAGYFKGEGSSITGVIADSSAVTAFADSSNLSYFADSLKAFALTGTTAELTVTQTGANAYTLSLPDSIYTTVMRAVRVRTGTLKLLDSGSDHYLSLSTSDDLDADYGLTFATGNANRSITLSGNPTLNDWFDQSVKTTANPTFGNLTITSMAGNWTNASRTIADLGTVTTADINGGTIDGVTIGGASAGAGTFTTLTGSGDVTIGGGAGQIPYIYLTGDSSSVGYYTTVIGRGMSAQNVFRMARGDVGALTATQSGDALGAFSFRGYTGAGWTGSKAFISAYAQENWTATENGTFLSFQTTAVDSTTLRERMRIDNLGRIGIGTSTMDSTLKVATTAWGYGGGMNVERGLKVGGLINNDELVKCTITVGGTVTARTFTVNVRRFDGVAGATPRYLVHWWVSTSEYGAPASISAGQTYEVTTGQELEGETTSAQNHAYTDASGDLVLTITNAESGNPASVYFHIEVQGQLYTANGTVNRPAS